MYHYRGGVIQYQGFCRDETPSGPRFVRECVKQRTAVGLDGDSADVVIEVGGERCSAVHVPDDSSPANPASNLINPANPANHP